MAESVLRHAPENEQQSFGRVVEVGVVHFVDRANEPLHERLFLVFTGHALLEQREGTRIIVD